MRPHEVERLVKQVRLLALEVATAEAGMQSAFASERAASGEVLIQLLDSMRSAFSALGDHYGPVSDAPGADLEYSQVILDQDRHGEWVACDHAELGLVIARRPDSGGAHRVWPGGELPSAHEGGPRLGQALERLVDRLASMARGKSLTRRREASQMSERLRAVQTLLRAP